MLEAKSQGLVNEIEPYVTKFSKSRNALADCQIRQLCAGFGNPAQQTCDLLKLSEAGMWVSSEVRQRILRLAGESESQKRATD